MQNIDINKQSEKIKFGVFLARMQPLHEGHLYVVRKMLKAGCENVVIVLGSQNKKDMIRNPFSFRVREKWLKDTIREEFGAEEAQKIKCFCLPDWSTETENSQTWGNYFYFNVVSRIKSKRFTLFSTEDLDMLNSWFSKEVRRYMDICHEPRSASAHITYGLSATKIRQAFVQNNQAYIDRWCPRPVVRSYEMARKKYLQVLRKPREDYSMA